MAKRSLLNRVKVPEFQKGIHENIILTNVDMTDRRGANGPINKMVYLKFAQLNESGKKVAESELAWWTPDITNDYFKTNLQEFCAQLHNLLEAYLGEEPAFDVFANVFDDIKVADQAEIETRKWKQSEFKKVIVKIKDAFLAAITPFIGGTDNTLRVKITTNYKGEDIEIPKYGKFIEPMSIEKTALLFTPAEIKTHSKAGNVSVAATSATEASPSNVTV